MNNGRAERASRQANRSRAFRAAGRHSTRVVVLRRMILGGALLGCAALVGLTFYNPFASPIQNVSIKGTNLDGTRITMEQPRLSGYRKDGRPYEVQATSGVQDVRQPNLIELNNLDARIGMQDKTMLHVVSPSGLYDSNLEAMDFKGAVRIKSDTGYDIDMKSAKMDFKAGTVRTDDPVKVLITGGEITAGSMNILDSGQNITFEGNVHSSFASADAPESPSKGTPR
jgi:lipopolysaccharide export system protein LptC